MKNNRKLTHKLREKSLKNSQINSARNEISYSSRQRINTENKSVSDIKSITIDINKIAENESKNKRKGSYKSLIDKYCPQTVIILNFILLFEIFWTSNIILCSMFIQIKLYIGLKLVSFPATISRVSFN